jgi:hypothetical protein
VRQPHANAPSREGSVLSFEDAIAYALEEPPAWIRPHREAGRERGTTLIQRPSHPTLGAVVRIRLSVDRVDHVPAISVNGADRASPREISHAAAVKRDL